MPESQVERVLLAFCGVVLLMAAGVAAVFVARLHPTPASSSTALSHYRYPEGKWVTCPILGWEDAQGHMHGAKETIPANTPATFIPDEAKCHLQ